MAEGTLGYARGVMIPPGAPPVPSAGGDDSRAGPVCTVRGCKKTPSPTRGEGTDLWKIGEYNQYVKFLYSLLVFPSGLGSRAGVGGGRADVPGAAHGRGRTPRGSG
jgi:hypothetical protein